MALATENSLKDYRPQKKGKRVEFRLPPQEDEAAQSRQLASTSRDLQGTQPEALSDPADQGEREVALVVEPATHVTMAQVHVSAEEESSDDGVDPNRAIRRVR